MFMFFMRIPKEVRLGYSVGFQNKVQMHFWIAASCAVVIGVQFLISVSLNGVDKFSINNIMFELAYVEGTQSSKALLSSDSA